MSVPVALADLPSQVSRFGLGPYLITVSPDQTPRSTSVAVHWEGGLLVGGLGRRTGANVAHNGAVTLLWPASVPGEHALIVDASAQIGESAGGGLTVSIRPTKAVLHVTRSSLSPAGAAPSS